MWLPINSWLPRIILPWYICLPLIFHFISFQEYEASTWEFTRFQALLVRLFSCFTFQSLPPVRCLQRQMSTALRRMPTLIFTWQLDTMMTSSNGNVFPVTGPLCGELTGDRWIPRMKASDVELWYFFFYLRLNKRLSKQSLGWWFETPSGSLWRQCNDNLFFVLEIISQE